MINSRRNRKVKRSSADVKVDVFKPLSRKRLHNIHYHEKVNSVYGNVLGYVREIHYLPTRANPIRSENSAERMYLLPKHLTTTSTLVESQVRDLQNKTVFWKNEEITGGLFMTPQFKKHNKDIKAYVVPSRRFGGVDDTPLYVPDMRLTQDAQLIGLLKRHDASNLHNRTLQEKGIATDDQHKQHDTKRIDNETLNHQDGATRGGGETEREFTDEEIKMLEDAVERENQLEEESLSELELTAEQRIVSQWQEIIKDEGTFLSVISQIPRPTSNNQIHTKNLLEEQLDYMRTVELAGIPISERHTLEHNLVSMDARRKRGVSGNKKYLGWIIATLKLTDRQIRIIQQKEGHSDFRSDEGELEQRDVEEEGAQTNDDNFFLKKN